MYADLRKHIHINRGILECNLSCQHIIFYDWQLENVVEATGRRKSYKNINSQHL